MATPNPTTVATQFQREVLDQRANLIGGEAQVEREVADLFDALIVKWRRVIQRALGKDATAADLAEAGRMAKVLAEMGRLSDGYVREIGELLETRYRQVYGREAARFRESLSAFGKSTGVSAGVDLIGVSARTIAQARLGGLTAVPVFQSFNRLGGGALAAMRRDLAEAVADGWKVDRLIRKWSGGQGAGRLRRDAEGLARSSLMAASNDAQVAVVRSEPGLFSGMRWEATFDLRTCPRCGAMHGKVFNVGHLPSLPLHINCRCVWIPVFRDSVLERGLSGPRRYHLPSPGATLDRHRRFESWLNKRPAGEQRDFFGSEIKYQAYKGGHLGLEAISDPAGGALTDAQVLGKLPPRVAQKLAPNR